MENIYEQICGCMFILVFICSVICTVYYYLSIDGAYLLASWYLELATFWLIASLGSLYFIFRCFIK